MIFIWKKPQFQDNKIIEHNFKIFLFLINLIFNKDLGFNKNLIINFSFHSFLGLFRQTFFKSPYFINLNSRALFSLKMSLQKRPQLLPAYFPKERYGVSIEFQPLCSLSAVWVPVYIECLVHLCSLNRGKTPKDSKASSNVEKLF